MFTIWNVLWQPLVFALGQEENADNADEGATSKNHMVEEIAFLVVQFHDGRGQHPKARTSQDKAKAATPVEANIVLQYRPIVQEI